MAAMETTARVVTMAAGAAVATAGGHWRHVWLVAKAMVDGRLVRWQPLAMLSALADHRLAMELAHSFVVQRPLALSWYRQAPQLWRLSWLAQ
mgnify:CR=1 FL=1